MTVHTRELGHSRLMTHSSHFGRRAMHTRRPCRISVCENHVHLSRGTSAIKSRSIFTGSFSVVRPSSVVSRCTWVSTTIPSFLPNQVPSTTFAVLRPTPGSWTSCSMVSGTVPPWRSISACAIPMMDLVLLRKNPVLWISCSRRSEEHTSELQSRLHLVCRLLLEKKKKTKYNIE